MRVNKYLKVSTTCVFFFNDFSFISFLFLDSLAISLCTDAKSFPCFRLQKRASKTMFGYGKFECHYLKYGANTTSFAIKSRRLEKKKAFFQLTEKSKAIIY